MENFAKRLALEHVVQGKVNRKNYPVIFLKDDFLKIRKCYDVLSESISLDIQIPPSGEWILDNFYIIEEQINGIELDLKFNKFMKLPAVDGHARIFLLAKELVEFTDGNVSKECIERFILAYQSKRKISMDEIWMFPIMLKICLIHYIRQICDRIVASQYQKFKVASLVERLVKNKPLADQSFAKYKSVNLNGEITTYIEFLTFLLKKEGKRTKKYVNILSEEVKKAGTTLDEVIKTEHFDMALRRVSMSNSITSIKNILRYNWTGIFERINGVEEILLQDVWYAKSDFDTKNLYRNEIQKISKKSKLSENYVADKLIEISKSEDEHIGEFLIGDKRAIFMNELGLTNEKKFSLNFKLFWYLFFIYVPTIIVSLLIVKKQFYLAIIPFSEVFVLIVNKLVGKLKRPKILPKLDEIPNNVNTLVIVPTLIKNKERVEEIISNLEVFSLANRIPNLYFALLGDASEEETEKMNFDNEVIETGISETKRLNEKYGEDKFFFLYRKRVFNKSQGKWLGYERKRGMITELTDFLVNGNEGTFIANTLQNLPKIKYIITLDADTEIPIDCAKKLIGTMEHPMNLPVVKGKTVVKGHALIQPKVGISMSSSTASIFSKVFAGSGGIDAYSTAESNVYEDLFDEAIFTGKGIFNVEIFNSLLKDEIPENTVLSHDLLEGSYLRCGLATDIEVIDGFPSAVNSYMLRLHRWTRGDWQILKWIFKGPLNNLSKYKIFDNLRRSVLDIAIIVLMFCGYFETALFVVFFPFILDLFEKILHQKDGVKAKNYLPIISGIWGSLIRSTINLVLLPYKAILMLEAIATTLYRMFISKSHLLEWVTADDAEKMLGKRQSDYLKEMCISFLLGILLVLTSIVFGKIKLELACAMLVIWGFAPFISFIVSDTRKTQNEKLTASEINDLSDIAFRTWNYFSDYMTLENNFLPPDNFQIDRKNKIVATTSSTNIGLGLMAIISAYDLKFIDLNDCMERLKNSIDTILKLEKWNGHLYNWYNIKTCTPLNPRFVSTVDSGNFVGYLYVVFEFLNDNNGEEYASIVSRLIKDTDFSKLYDFDKNLFSIGYDVRENKLVDSYYDLFASEARLASYVAIAKNDVPSKHWFNMSRTLTMVDRFKGLVSWSGTMFEYFMPLVVMKPYKYTLLDETYEFCIYSQKKYAKKLNIPWGISESAFNLQDLYSNYQYKAFGIPWLGLKRGLKEEVVVSPYSSILALQKNPSEVLKNIFELKKLGAYDKYGFYDAIDFTPQRVSKAGHEVVKTYMVHHEALILLSINNYMNDNVLQKRFSENPELKSAELLLQERVPTEVVFTNNKKEKVKVLKYKSYDEHFENIINIPCGNVNIESNNNYTLLINDFGEGYSMFDNILLTRHKDGAKQGCCLYVKNLDDGSVISNTFSPIYENVSDYEVVFSPSQSRFFRSNDSMEITTKIAVSPEDNIEIREVEIKNISNDELNLDVISYVEPVLTNRNNDIVHPAYNNLFMRSSRFENAVVLEKRSHDDKIFYLNFLVSDENDYEVELDKAKVVGRLNDLSNPNILNSDIAFSNQNDLCTNTIIAIKKNCKIASGTSKKMLYFYGVSRDYDEIVSMYKKYSNLDAGKRIFELAYSKSLVENRFLGYKGKEIMMYNKLLSVIENNSSRGRYLDLIKQNVLKQHDLWKFGISGDLPIILARINRVNDIYVIKDLIMAIEYFFKKNILVDLVILNEEENKYEQYVQDKIYETISRKGLIYLLNRNGGIHIVKKLDISPAEECLFYSCCDLVINARDGFLKEQLYEG